MNDRIFHALTRLIPCLLLFLTCASETVAAGPVQWQTRWSEVAFTQAAREHKFVLLDLHAVWCHWCHVMDATTYSDPAVRALLAQHYVSVSVDADSDPALTTRYGDWGWPATIVLGADGTEIVKRRGYIAPQQMVSLLEAIVADPTPGPSVRAAPVLMSRAPTSLSGETRTALTHTVDQLYDETHAGWGTVHKYIDAAAIEWSFAQLDEGEQSAIHKVRRTLDENQHLIDPVWGGVFQYSDAVDWKSPHFEKLLAFQADDLRVYSEAYARWQRPEDRAAATRIEQYLTGFLSAPDGGFYVSQDADVSPGITGHDFYARDAAGRKAAGAPPIDVHEYAREAGWAMAGLAKYYDVMGEPAALERAMRAARWSIGARALPGGGFSHAGVDSEIDRAAGPFLDDNVAMLTGLIALYRSSGDRAWIQAARRTLVFIEQNLRDPQAGYRAARLQPGAHGVFALPVRDVSQNAALARAANLLQHYTGGAQARHVALHAMKFLSAAGAATPDQYRPEILLADHELGTAPIHITVVGSKANRDAQALHAVALRYPAEYLQVDWWDRSEGPLPNPAITYPLLPRAAAFACTANACSTPVFDAAELAGRVRSIMN